MTETSASYPIGHFTPPAAFDAAQRAAAIETIAALPAALREAVRGLSSAQLDTPYRDGGWTVRQLVHHVADSHMNAFIRMRLALTEDAPLVKPYEEKRWADLPDMRMDPEVSLGILDGLHARWATMLRALSPADFARTFEHPESGTNTIDRALALYAWHSRHHLAHATTLRARMGW